jgi:hypothetical protein
MEGFENTICVAQILIRGPIRNPGRRVLTPLPSGRTFPIISIGESQSAVRFIELTGPF